MRGIELRSYGRALLILITALCLMAGGADARNTDQVWPITKVLKSKVDDLDIWIDVGQVTFWNTRDELMISIEPDGYMLAELNIHVVQEPAEFASVLNNKGKPVAGYFDYKNEFSPAVDGYVETIPFADFDQVCWGLNPDVCPPFFIIVHAELVGLGEASFAEGEGVFYRLDKNDGSFWAWYVDYPLAKPEAGHFVDANVNGLTFATPTQHGTTGDEGHFWYLPDESVWFAVGSLDLGDALADRAVSPVDLFEGADMDDDRVLNVARLLQSLDADGMHDRGAINITEPVIACLENALVGLPPIPPPEEFFADDAAVGALIAATVAGCDVPLVEITKDEARDNLDTGMKAGNLIRRNVSKSPEMASDKAKLEVMPVYVPALTSDGMPTLVTYYDADGNEIEARSVAKPIVVAYLEEVEDTGVMDVFVAISRDDGQTFKRRNISRTSGRSSKVGYPGKSEKPMLKVKDDMIFVAWTDKYCNGGRPGYAITVCPDTNGDGSPDPCEICRTTDHGTTCTPDYPGDDAYWRDDLYGAGGPQRTVIYEDYPELGEVPYSCVWTTRGVVLPDGEVQWFKPERVTSGRRDANQLFAGAGDDVAFAIVWQEDPKGLMPGDGDGPGEGWSGANTHGKTDIWYSYISESDFALVDTDYPVGGHGDNTDLVDQDPELQGRVKALVPMSLPVKISDNDVCSEENMDPDGGNGEHDFDGEGEGTHRYCGTLDGIGTAANPGPNPLCAYTIEKINPNDELHHVCVTADNRLLDGNTGASRPMIFVQPYTKTNGSKSAYVIIGYEEGKGVGTPPEEEGEGEDDRYKPDMGKNVIYHSFDLFNPETVGGGGLINLPETDEFGNPVYLVDEFGELLLDWKGDPILATENARRVRFIVQPKKKAGTAYPVLVALYRQGEEGSGKPADVFMRSMYSLTSGNPYAFNNFVPGAQNLSSVEATELFQDPFDPEAPVKMLRWGWSPANLADSSAANPYSDALAHRGALEGGELIIAYSWTPNWGRNANDKYDLYVRRSFDGGLNWTTDPGDPEAIEHNVVFRVPVVDYDTQTVSWDEEVVTTEYGPGELEPPRNVSNLRNNRISVLEPRLVKTPGDILTNGIILYPEDSHVGGVYQVAFGIEFNQNQAPNDVTFPKMPMDIYYGRTLDKGQRYETVIVTPQGGSGQPEEGWNLLAKDQPEQGAAQLRQTPDGSRMYAVWLEESDQGSDIMFRRVDYR